MLDCQACTQMPIEQNLSLHGDDIRDRHLRLELQNRSPRRTWKNVFGLCLGGPGNRFTVLLQASCVQGKRSRANLKSFCLRRCKVDRVPQGSVRRAQLFGGPFGLLFVMVAVLIFPPGLELFGASFSPAVLLG